MPSEYYLKALKTGKNTYRRAVAEGRYPYLPALDSFIDKNMVRTEEPLGLVSIPLNQIAGTKTVGRQTSFACDFMPLMPEKSEFAWKWDSVAQYHLDQGVGDPIEAYEFMNRFYVLEGNKRVSVLKFFNADSVEGTVTRLVPYETDAKDNQIYYEFMDFYRDSQINYLSFSDVGSFPRLIKAVGKKSGEKWTDDEKMDFRACYYQFAEIFNARYHDRNVTPADALLFYLSLYPYEQVREKTVDQMRADMDKVLENLPILSEENKTDVSVVYRPSEDPGEGVFTRFFRLNKVRQLKSAFIHDKPASDSGWTYMHELGRMSLENTFGERISTEAHFLKDSETDISELLEETIASGNHVIFTTSSKFLAASLKASIEHPEAKILNCSLGQPYTTLRTYYGRLYEAKYLCGMVAGAMTPNDRIAYQAPFPNYGAIADINAFTLGARMVNPRAQVYLHWESRKDEEPLRELLLRENISVISDNDTIRPSSKERVYGLYTTEGGSMKRLAVPIWNWGKFYERIIRDFLQGNWDSVREAKEKPAINYWWGISSGIIDLIMSDELPSGIRTLTNMVRGEMYMDYFHPFWGTFLTQDKTTAGQPDQALPAEEIIRMDYLADGVIGSIPRREELNADAREVIELQRNLTPDATVIG